MHQPKPLYQYNTIATFNNTTLSPRLTIQYYRHVYQSNTAATFTNATLSPRLPVQHCSQRGAKQMLDDNEWEDGRWCQLYSLAVVGVGKVWSQSAHSRIALVTGSQRRQTVHDCMGTSHSQYMTVWAQVTVST